MHIKPLFDRIIVEKIEEEKISSGGIIMPNKEEEPMRKGEIIAAGPGKREDRETVPMAVKVGDVVCFGEFAGVKYEKDGKKYLAMKEADIIGTVREEKEEKHTEPGRMNDEVC